jgi:DNA-binding NarL/FixJ family response regulator
MNTEILVGIVDDHALFRKGLAALINLFPGHQVVLLAENGKDMIENLKAGNEPTILLLDIDMREMYSKIQNRRSSNWRYQRF